MTASCLQVLGEKPDLPSGGGDDFTADASNRKKAKLFKVGAVGTHQISTIIFFVFPQSHTVVCHYQR